MPCCYGQLVGKVLMPAVILLAALVGVAGNETIGCDLYYDSSACDGGAIKVVYGSGFWSGVVCEATVTLGAYNVTNYKFGAYQKQKAMTTCERTHEDDATSPRHMTQPHNYMQGIVGLTAGEVGRTAGSPPLHVPRMAVCQISSSGVAAASRMSRSSATKSA